MNLLARDGVLCFITSNSFLRANYGLPLRQYLHKGTISHLIDIESSQVFSTAIVNVSILVAHASYNDRNCIIVAEPWNKGSFGEYVNNSARLYSKTILISNHGL